MADSRDFLKLFMAVQGDLLAYILSMGVPSHDADDVLQSSAMVLFDKFDTFEEGTNFRAWAYTVVRNEILHALRSGARRPLELTDEAYQEVSRLATDDTEVPAVRLSALNVCLEKVQANVRSIINMRYRDEMPLQAIAEALKRPVESIYTTLSRARKFLNECVERFEHLEGEAV